MAEAFGVPAGKGGSIDRFVKGEKFTLTRGVTTKRWTFLLAKDGHVLYKNDKVQAPMDSSTVLNFLKKEKHSLGCRPYFPEKNEERLKSLAKTRPVDLKVGKKGITENLLSEIKRILEDDSLLKLKLSPEKPIRLEQVAQLETNLPVCLIAMVGKTASFSKDRDMKKPFHLTKEPEYPILQPPMIKVMK